MKPCNKLNFLRRINSSAAITLLALKYHLKISLKYHLQFYPSHNIFDGANREIFFELSLILEKIPGYNRGLGGKNGPKLETFHPD